MIDTNEIREWLKVTSIDGAFERVDALAMCDELDATRLDRNAWKKRAEAAIADIEIALIAACYGVGETPSYICAICDKHCDIEPNWRGEE